MGIKSFTIAKSANLFMSGTLKPPPFSVRSFLSIQKNFRKKKNRLIKPLASARGRRFFRKFFLIYMFINFCRRKFLPNKKYLSKMTKKLKVAFVDLCNKENFSPLKNPSLVALYLLTILEKEFGDLLELSLI